MPVRTGFLEAQAGWTSELGAMAGLKLGAHLTPRSSAFAFGQLDQQHGASVGLGYQFEFDL